TDAAIECADQSQARQAPELHRAIASARCEDLVLRGEQDARGSVVLSGDGAGQSHAGLDGNEKEILVEALDAEGRLLSVGREGARVDRGTAVSDRKGPDQRS